MGPRQAVGRRIRPAAALWNALTMGLMGLVGPTLLPARAVAQPEAAVASMSSGGAEELTAPTPTSPRLDAPEDRAENPMGWAGLGLKIGLAGMGPSKVTVYGERVGSRSGLLLALPLHLGGDGFGWSLEPYLAFSTTTGEVRDESGRAVGRRDVSLRAYGVYTGPQAQIHVARSAYVGVGVGIKGAYVANDGFDYAFDLYGRVPVSATYYVTDELALALELGLGYGASVFADLPRIRTDLVTGETRNVKSDPSIATAFTWDASFSVRLP